MINFLTNRFIAFGMLGLTLQGAMPLSAGEEPTPDDKAEAKVLADSKQISAWEVNEVHRRFISLCMQELPDEVTLHYLGTVVTDNGRLKQRVEHPHGHNIGALLSWHVVRDLVLFEFSISTTKSEGTVSQCTIEGRTLYVNVSFVDKNRDIKVPLPELGGVSVQDVVRKLAAPAVPKPASGQR
jgi:hypothetical protein